MKRIFVIGAGFGDEGKGRVTDTLLRQQSFKDISSTCVVRYSGGPQAAHNVVYEHTNHIYSHFGAGTGLGVSTYWNHHCLVCPETWLNELRKLSDKKLIHNNIKFHVHPDCPIITPWDVQNNQSCLLNTHHGTCGFGINKTKRREEQLYSLTVGDLRFPTVARYKAKAIREWYAYKDETNLSLYTSLDIDVFLEDCANFINNPLVDVTDIQSLPYSHFLYESSQGLLIDEQYGFFPNVTPSKVGYSNSSRVGYVDDELYYVTRAYHTRHGNGPFPCITKDIEKYVEVTHTEHNINNTFQKHFKVGLLNLELLCYGLVRDTRPQFKSINLVVTCMDNMKEFALSYGTELFKFDTKEKFLTFIQKHVEKHTGLNVNILYSSSPHSKFELEKLK